MRTLVVDDSLIIRDLLKDMLSELGHEVVGEAEDLDGALAEFRRSLPDLVTLDLSLLRSTGLEVLKAFAGESHRARVMVVSGNSQPQVREEAKRLGAGSFLTKPFDIESLRASIAELSA